jgi:hypothetical protein
MMNNDQLRLAKEQIKNIIEPDASATARIRELNDQLRVTGRGGVIVMTYGIAGLGGSLVATIFKAVSEFNQFSEDNDPWGEHDCALLTVEGVKVLWKIDYYDRQRRFHSSNPADPKVTVRVMTVMRADEY